MIRTVSFSRSNVYEHFLSQASGCEASRSILSPSMRVRLNQQRLLAFLAQSPLSQNHWAIKLGLSRGHWSEIVNGKHLYPSPKTRERMLEVLGIPFEELFEIEAGTPGWADTDFRRAIADRYLIDSELGQGGMGAVYLARDARHGRIVAVKVISPEAVSGIGVLPFLREIATVAQLQHPNTLPLYDSGEAAGHPFYVMPYIRGGSLRARLRAVTRLPPSEVARLTAGIAAGLHHAHEQRILHCDIKPENILLDGSHPYVMDFGIARKLHTEVLPWTLRRELDFSAGTPAYVSPEQASGDVELGPTSDIYSLACVVYEMLSGRPPFEGTTTQSVVTRRFLSPPPPLREFAPEVPALLEAAVERGMALDPKRRPQRAPAFAQSVATGAENASTWLSALSRGMTRVVSRLRAGRRRTVRLRWGGEAMGTVIQDVRFGARMLLKHPGFAAVTVLTLALGIGANTAAFSVVNAVLLRPLPFHAPERLVAVGQTEARDRENLSQFSFRNFADLREQAKSFERLAAYYNNSVTLTGQGEAVRLRGVVATADLFPLLGASPALGRTFFPDEDHAGGGAQGYPAILGWECWQRHFGGDPQVIGRSINLNENAYTVVGVMPAKFSFPVQAQPVEVWISPARDAERQGEGAIMVSRGYHGWRVVGRLKDGATVEQAQAEADVVASTLAEQFAEANKDMGINLMPLLDWLVGNLRLTLLLLCGVVGVVLLIACANVANLLLERAVSRQREISVRLALGAARWRIARQLVTENLMLALAGGALGTLLAIGGTSLMVALSPEGFTRITETRLDARVLGFTALVSLLTGVLLGLAPAFSVSRLGLAESLKEGGRSGAGGVRSGRTRNLLVVVEVALALVLLVGAGLLVRTLVQMQNVPLGFDPRNVLTMTVAKSPTGGPEQTAEFFRQLTERVRALPGVAGASVTWQLPLSGASAMTSLNIEGQPSDPANTPMGVIHAAGPGYFRTMGIPLLRGRDFTDHDDMRSAPVIIVNETLARRFFPDGNAIGRHILPGFSMTGQYKLREIVGVVGDVKHQGLRGGAVPEFYFAQAQMPVTSMTLVVRTAGDPHALVAFVRSEVRAMDANAPVFGVLTAEGYLSRSVASTRFNMTLLATFAALALVMTAVGLYGVISFSVSQSTREIGIRVALGAQGRDALRLVMGRGMTLTLAGVVSGLAAALGLTRVMASLLFGVGATDPATFAGVALLLVAVAALACYVPARRATKVDPMVALRYE
jgi:putative ABC transport system permease protein